LKKFLNKGTGQKACFEIDRLIGFLQDAGGEFCKAIDMAGLYDKA